MTTKKPKTTTKPQVKTYPVPAPTGPQSGMPVSLFDPRWNEPATAARIAHLLWSRLPAPDPSVVVVERLQTSDAKTDDRTLAVAVDVAADGRRLKGTSLGELHRRYGTGVHTTNFHAQAVTCGVDDSGLFFLCATVGRFDGPWGNTALLAATFMKGAEHIVVGSVVWERNLDPVGDHKVVVVGQDPRLAKGFDDVTHIRFSFEAKTGVDVKASVVAKPLSNAKRSVLVAEIKAAFVVDDEQRDRRLRKSLVGLADVDVKALVSAGAPGHEALVAALLLGAQTDG